MTGARWILTFGGVENPAPAVPTRSLLPHGAPARETTRARVLLLVLALIWFALASRMRFGDELGPACWIEPPRMGRIAGKAAGFVGRFVLPFEVPEAEIKLTAENSYRVSLDGLDIGSGEMARDELHVWTLRGPISTGAHEILVLVDSKGAGRPRLRLGLDGARVGRNCVVTDATWRVGDDAKTLRERGFDGASYRATVSETFSSWLAISTASSARRSWRGSADVSKTAVNSRMPSRAITQ